MRRLLRQHSYISSLVFLCLDQVHVTSRLQLWIEEESKRRGTTEGSLWHMSAHQQLAAEQTVISHCQAPQCIIMVGVHPRVIKHQIRLEAGQQLGQNATHLAAGRPGIVQGFRLQVPLHGNQAGQQLRLHTDHLAANEVSATMWPMSTKMKTKTSKSRP